MFKNLRIGLRLASGFGASMALLLALAAYGVIQMGHMHNDLDHVVNREMRVQKLLMQLRSNFQSNTNVLYDAMLKSDWKPDSEIVLAGNSKNNARIFDDFHRMALSQQSVQAIKHAESMMQQAHKAEQDAVHLMGSGLFIQAVPVFTEQYLPLAQKTQTELERLAGLQDKRVQEAYRSSESDYKAARLWGLLLSLGALGVAVAISVSISRSLTRQLGGEPADVARVAQAIAAGDLSQDGRTAAAPAGSVMGAMQAMREQLLGTLVAVRAAADRLGGASGQVAHTAQDLSRFAALQASSMQQTSATLQQAGVSIRNNADSARQSDAIAREAAAQARETGDAVRRSVDAMQSIADRIGVVDEIAYQTNMLALNAAIEAARAGDDGKGFAVVASEVRKLAERSQLAAREIGELASDTLRQAQGALDQLQRMVPTIGRTSGLVQDIAQGSDQQAAGMQQINQAMSELNGATQQNARASEQLADTAEEMRAQALALQTAMEQFRFEATPREEPSAGSMSPGEAQAPRRGGRTWAPLAA